MGIVFITLTGVTVLLIALFGIRVYLADRKNKVNQSFALFTLISAVWLIFDFLAYQTSLADFQLIINRIIFTIVCFLVLLLALFVYLFPRPIFKVPNILQYIVLICGLLVGLLSLFTGYIVQDITMESWGSNLILGSGFLIFAIYVSVLAIFPIIILIIKLIKFKGIEKEQIKYILYGIASFAVLNLLFNMFIPSITKNFEFARFGTYSTIFFVGFTAYAILKHQLFNIKVILAETAAVIIDVILAVQIFTSHTIIEALLRAIFAVAVFYGSYLLVGSVRREIKFREEMQVMSEQLARANAHLKDLDKMKTEFVSLASHELLTPVSAIEGYLSMILDEHLAKVDDPKAIQYMDRIYRSSRRLARLISDMLNISRIEEGRLLVEKKDVNLSDLIKQVIEEVKFKAEEKKQKIVFEGQEKFETYGDADKIKEVIVNIIGNSIKYSKNPGTITVNIEKVPTQKVNDTWAKIEADVKERPLDDQEAIHAAVDPHFREIIGNEQILISVKDQGIGIPKDELPRLFKKFHRVGDYTTAESQGTGLGLYISRALVELHHGRIWADSEGPSHGATFSFSLPDITSKEQIISLEKEVPQDKEQLKPLAKPMNSKHEEDI